MGRSRYKIIDEQAIHFVTCTVLHWIPIFTKIETKQIIIESLQHLQKSDNLKIYSYVILENHLHLIVSSDNLNKSLQKFKSFTAKKILNFLITKNVKTILQQLEFYKKAHKREISYQFWEEGTKPKQIISDEMLNEKIEYVHCNPVKRGYVANPEDWIYSSAGSYLGNKGLLEIERLV